MTTLAAGRVASLLAVLFVMAPHHRVSGQEPDSAVQAPAEVQAPEAPSPDRVRQDTTVTGELRSLFARIEELRDVQVAVDGGVALLTGTTLDQEAREAAVALASRFPDVLYVDDRIRVETSLVARTRPVLDDLGEQALGWIARLPVLLVALGIVLAFGLLARIVASVRWPRAAADPTSFSGQLVRRAAWAVLWGIGLVLALELLDATALVGAMLGAAGVLGLAFGFAFRNVAENWLAGVLLGLRKPFELDDVVSVGGHQGTVVRLTHTDTVLMTADGNHLRIPNAVVFNGLVVNYTRNPLRRLRLTYTFPRGADIERIREVLLEGLAGGPAVGNPAPQILIVSVGDSSVSLEVRAWIDQQATDFVRAEAAAYRATLAALDAAGIGGPTSVQYVHMVEEAEEKSRRGEPSGPTGEETAPDPAVARLIEVDRRTSGEADLLGRS